MDYSLENTSVFYKKESTEKHFTLVLLQTQFFFFFLHYSFKINLVFYSHCNLALDGTLGNINFLKAPKPIFQVAVCMLLIQQIWAHFQMVL